MGFDQFITWLFYGVMGGVSAFGVYILAKLLTSVEELNVKMAVIIFRTEDHEKRLDKLEEY